MILRSTPDPTPTQLDSMAKKKAARKTTARKTTAKKAASRKSPAKKARDAEGVDTTPEMSVEEMLEVLSTSDDQAEKRRIRARLRSRGHTGGLRETDAKPVAKKATKKKATKKKATKKKATA